ncbi:MAG: xylose isomerase [Gemmatimonadetes bacterium]|nr:xylose isomerase [Gemmatimonadota bacterium]
MTVNRREFVATLGAVLAARRVPQERAIKIGYAAITWGGNDSQAIDDIASLGYPGIQLRSNVLAQFGDRPAELRALLAQRGLTFVALSSGAIRVDSPDAAAMIDAHVRNARFLRDAGGSYLQLTVDRPAGRAVTDADYAGAGRLLSEIGRRTADVGIPLGFHPHMGSLAERPAELDRVMAAADPRYVKLLLDVAHYQQGGGDPAAAIRRYRDRLLFLHVKDVRDMPSANGGYQFVELGQGKVNVRGVFAALAEVSFRGWVVVELDAVPEPGRSPKESAAMSKRYLASIGVAV